MRSFIPSLYSLLPTGVFIQVKFELKDIDNFILNNWKVILGDDTYVSPNKNYCEINPVYGDYKIEPIYDIIKQYVSLRIEKPDNIDNCKVYVAINDVASDTPFNLPNTINNITDEDTIQVIISNNSIENYVFDNWEYISEPGIIVNTSTNNTVITISNIIKPYSIKPVYKRKYNFVDYKVLV